MLRPYSLPLVASLALVLLLLASCSESADQLDTSEPWDLVWITDSMGAGVAEAWADRIEEAEGVEVRMHNHTTDLLSLVQVRDWLNDRAVLRDEVADTEIIVVYGNPLKSGIPMDTGTCVSTSPTPRDPPHLYTAADLAPYGDVLRDIYDLVFELRAGQPTVIRAFDEFNGMLADWREAGIEEECTAAWESQSEALREAADEYKVAFASFYGEFNGVDYDEDAREKGYIASDGRHASPEGVLAQAEVLHALGYDPIVP
jgi:hypothetical protein